MPRTQRNKALTILIYFFLLAAVSTYFLPFIGVSVPALGTKSWSVRDIVKTLPRAVRFQRQGEHPLSTHFDFIDFVREISPKAKEGGLSRAGALNLALAALVPVSAILAYAMLVVGFLAAPMKKSAPFACIIGTAVVSACYCLLGVYYFNGIAQRAFSEALSKVTEGPFAFLTKQLIQQVSIGPSTALFGLTVCSVLIFLVHLFRMSKEGK